MAASPLSYLPAAARSNERTPAVYDSVRNPSLNGQHVTDRDDIRSYDTTTRGGAREGADDRGGRDTRARVRAL